MKKSLLVIVIIGLIFTLVADIMPADTKLKGKSDGKPSFQASHPVERETQSGISWEMPFTPSVIHSSNYYDYMIGSYSSIPIKPQPESVVGGGWFYNFMAKPSASGNRRVYYGWMDDNGPSADPSLFTGVDAWEGYPSMDIDDLGHMVMSWHSVGADDVADVKYGYDSFFAGIPGIASDAFMLMDNPTTFNGHDDNEFIWPNVQVGESPLGADYQRVYVLASNTASHSVISETSGEAQACENVYIGFADYTAQDVDFGTELTWTYTSIPTIDAWNVDTNEWRRPYYTFTIGKGANAGKIFYIGTHLGDLADGEPSFDVFIHDDYANPTTDWRMVSFNIEMPLDNPTNANNDYLFMDDENNVPFELHWDIVNTSHYNVSWDEQGRIHMPATWAILTQTDSYYYYFHNVKDMIFDTNDETLAIVDVFPQSLTPGARYIPWDMDADGEADAYWDDGSYDGVDDGITPDVEGYGNLKYDTIWPFQHWDSDSHEEAMFFNLNHLKVTNANEDGVMAMLWLDSTAGRDFNADNLTYWQPYESTPEIFISISGDNGNNWTEPLALSGVDVADDFWFDDDGGFLGFNESHEYVPAWDGMTTMYAYPSEYLKSMGTDEAGNDIYRMFLMFHSDDDWGSSIIGEGQAGMGEVLMNAIDFHVPSTVSNDEQSQPVVSSQLRQNYPNPFSPLGTTIEYNVKSNGNVNVSVYNIKGQLVKTLVDEAQNANNHSVIWNGEDNSGVDAPSGVYFYRLKSGNTVETKKLIKIK